MTPKASTPSPSKLLILNLRLRGHNLSSVLHWPPLTGDPFTPVLHPHRTRGCVSLVLVRVSNVCVWLLDTYPLFSAR